ncbi:MAG: glycosyltransferase family A protein [Patescibacteria group bacterium]
MPKISIIIPVYNQAKSLQKCLVSLFSQTFRDFELIIVDDGSKEAIATAVAPWQEGIRLIRQENKGAAAARNAGFKESGGQYLFFCDADIILKLSALEKMLTALENDESAAFAYSSFKFGWKKFRLWPFDSEKLKQLPYIHSTSLIRRKFFPGWDESLKKFQDWDLFLTISERGGRGIWLDEVLFTIKTGGTMSHWLPSFIYQLPVKTKNKEKYLKAKELIQKKHQLT